MINLLLYFTILFISIGAVAGSILIVNYLRKSYPVVYIESYFYYVILMSAFGVYGIWGSVFMKTILDQITISNKLLVLLSQVIPYVGFPFLIMAWYMFLKFCYEFSLSKMPRTVSLSYFFFHLFFFIALGWSIMNINSDALKVPSISLIYVFIALDIVLTGWGLLLLFIKSRKASLSYAGFLMRYIILSYFLLGLRIVSVICFYYFPISIPGFILMYFLSIVFPLLYFYYNISNVIASDHSGQMLSSYENILARYGITKREREIIKEVCAGKSNQEIADTLFISLQTVKDHTHRIYLKMDIKRRVQLIKMMQME
jgi:DNA-binding CsgD family transcriptional regulator